MNFKDISGSSITNNINSTSYVFNNTITYNDSFNGDRINQGGSSIATGIVALIALGALSVIAYMIIQNAGLIALLAGGTYVAYRLDKSVFKDSDQGQPIKYLEVK